MSPVLSIVASLSPTTRQKIGLKAVARTVPISDIAATHQVSRKFVYQQGDKAQQALNESFTPSQGDDEVLFHLPVTKSWLYQLILGLVLICHSSYRRIKHRYYPTLGFGEFEAAQRFCRAVDEVGNYSGPQKSDRWLSSEILK